MKIESRFFTIEEANALLPEIEARLHELQVKAEVYRRRHDEVFMEELLADTEKHQAEVPANELEANQISLEKAIVRLEEDIQKIRELGCILRSVERGWVDFPSRRGDETVYFCWKRGEKAIQYYHTAQEPWSTRHPLS